MMAIGITIFILAWARLCTPLVLRWPPSKIAYTRWGFALIVASGLVIASLFTWLWKHMP